MTRHVTERRDSERVVPARERQLLDRDIFHADRFQKLISESWPKSWIVTAADSEHSLPSPVDLANIWERADGRPVSKRLLFRDVFLHRSPHIRGGKAVRDDFAKIA